MCLCGSIKKFASCHESERVILPCVHSLGRGSGYGGRSDLWHGDLWVHLLFNWFVARTSNRKVLFQFPPHGVAHFKIFRSIIAVPMTEKRGGLERIAYRIICPQRSSQIEAESNENNWIFSICLDFFLISVRWDKARDAAEDHAVAYVANLPYMCFTTFKRVSGRAEYINTSSLPGMQNEEQKSKAEFLKIFNHTEKGTLTKEDF